MRTLLSIPQLEAGLDHIRQSPKDNGTLEMIVRRPAEDEREELDEGLLDLDKGLIGDSWKNRPSSKTPDKSPHPGMQLNIMNARAIALIAQDKNRWKWAGDQLYIDLDLSDENLLPGTQIAIGEAIIEITAIPHNGCKKFAQRFGVDAVRFVNSPAGKQLHLRGLNAKVIRGGIIRRGEKVSKV